VVDLANTHFVYEAFHGDHRLLVALNLTDAPVTRQIPYLGDIVAGNAACHHTGASQAQMILPPHGWAILG
jgi:cyclomaltodextrinase